MTLVSRIGQKTQRKTVKLAIICHLTLLPCSWLVTRQRSRAHACEDSKALVRVEKLMLSHARACEVLVNDGDNITHFRADVLGCQLLDQ